MNLYIKMCNKNTGIKIYEPWYVIIYAKNYTMQKN
jgi:hypothetical protein